MNRREVIVGAAAAAGAAVLPAPTLKAVDADRGLLVKGTECWGSFYVDPRLRWCRAATIDENGETWWTFAVPDGVNFIEVETQS